MTILYFIRKKSDPDFYWSGRLGWTDRAHADLLGEEAMTSPAIQAPPDGVWVDSYYGSLEEYYDKQEQAGIPVDEGLRPTFPFRPNGRHTPDPRHSLAQCRTDGGEQP